jgi:hypothetical protein
MHGVAGSASSSQVSASHSTRSALPPAQYVPGAHASQFSPSLVPCPSRTVPAVHSLAPVQAPAFIPVLLDPSGQPLQVRSTRAVPPVTTNSPALQFVHGVQSEAFSCAEKDPLGHGSQRASWLGEPASATKVPAAQTLWGKHLVAPGSPLNVPLSHGTQSAPASAVELKVVRECSPAGHCCPKAGAPFPLTGSAASGCSAAVPEPSGCAVALATVSRWLELVT